jgi:vancomycin resistance protein YoaR
VTPRRLLLVGAGVGLVLVAGAAAAVASGDGVPRGVSVAGVDVGGLSAAEAQRRIVDELASRVAAPVRLAADGEKPSLDPRDGGLAVDAAASARRAADAAPLDRLRARLGVEVDLEPVVSVDRDALERALEEVAQRFDRPPREASISFDEELEPVVVQPLAGRSLDVPGAADAVVDAWLADEPVEVPVVEEEVETTSDDVEQALDEIAEPALAAPVVVDSEGGALEIDLEAIAAALRIEADDNGELAPVVDGEVLLERTAGLRRDIEEAAVDATFDTSSGTPVVVPSKPGRGFAADDLASAVESVLTDPAPRRTRASFTTVEARVTTELAVQLGVVEEIGSFTTRFTCCQPRVTNIQRIADIVDGYVVLPGETFDLNAYVGPRDTARGFVPAPQILDGEFVDAVGGGVSQFATTLFNAYFFAGLEDVEHKPHSYYISRYPAGREATVSFPEPDLTFRNDSPHGVLIRATSTGTSVTVTMWGTKRFDVRAVAGPRTRVTTAPTRYIERPDCIPGDGGPGFDIVVTRVFSQEGREVRREDFKTRYLPQPEFVCGPPP